jgi:hypothetical protein
MHHTHAWVPRVDDGPRIPPTVRSDQFARWIPIRPGGPFKRRPVTGFLSNRWADGRIGLLAAAPLRGLKLSPPYYLGLAILVVLLVVALVKAYQMWEEIHDVPEPDSPTDLLASFEEAHAAGELDDLEFERVKRRLVGPTIGGEDITSAPAEGNASEPDQS